MMDYHRIPYFPYSVILYVKSQNCIFHVPIIFFVLSIIENQYLKELSIKKKKPLGNQNHSIVQGNKKSKHNV